VSHGQLSGEVEAEEEDGQQVVGLDAQEPEPAHAEHEVVEHLVLDKFVGLKGRLVEDLVVLVQHDVAGDLRVARAVGVVEEELGEAQEHGVVEEGRVGRPVGEVALRGGVVLEQVVSVRVPPALHLT